jgi:hypothetical protein
MARCANPRLRHRRDAASAREEPNWFARHRELARTSLSRIYSWIDLHIVDVVPEARARTSSGGILLWDVWWQCNEPDFGVWDFCSWMLCKALLDGSGCSCWRASSLCWSAFYCCLRSLVRQMSSGRYSRMALLGLAKKISTPSRGGFAEDDAEKRASAQGMSIP